MNQCCGKSFISEETLEYILALANRDGIHLKEISISKINFEFLKEFMATKIIYVNEKRFNFISHYGEVSVTREETK